MIGTISVRHTADKPNFPLRPAAVFCAAATLILASPLPSRAAVPLSWEVKPGQATPVVFDRFHGETLHLSAKFTGFGEAPFAPGADVRLWYQTNGMDSAWWSVPATVESNRVSAVWSPELDPGAERVNLFFGAPSNAYCSAVLRLRGSPGVVPNALPAPKTLIDFSTIETLNAPYYTKAEANDKLDAIGNALAGKADRGDIPLAVSQLSNDSGFIGPSGGTVSTLGVENDLSVTGNISTVRGVISTDRYGEVHTGRIVADIWKNATVGSTNKVTIGEKNGAIAVESDIPYELVDKTPTGAYIGRAEIFVDNHAVNFVRQRYRSGEYGTYPYDEEWVFYLPRAESGRMRDFYLQLVAEAPEGISPHTIQQNYYTLDDGTERAVIVGRDGSAKDMMMLYNSKVLYHFTEFEAGRFWLTEEFGDAYVTPQSKLTDTQLSNIDAVPNKADTSTVTALSRTVTSHTGNTNNPHSVTCAQIGAVADNGGVANKLLLASSGVAPYTTGLRVYHSRGNNWYLEGVVNGETVGRVRFPEAVVSGGVNNGALLALTSDIENGVLASYEAAESYTPIAATDTVVQAVAKLEAGLLATPTVELVEDKLRTLDWASTSEIERWRANLSNGWLAENFPAWSASTSGNSTALVSRNRSTSRTGFQYDHTNFPSNQVVFTSTNDHDQNDGAWFEREVTVPAAGYYEVELAWGCVMHNGSLAYPAIRLSAAGQTVDIVGEADSTLLQAAKASFLLQAGTATIRIEAMPIASKLTGLVFSQFDFRLVRTTQAELVICDDSLTPLVDTATGAKFESPVGSYAQQNLMHWTGADIGQAKVLRNRPSEETYWQYDTSLFPDQIVLWVEGKTSANEVGWFERTVAVPVAGIYEVEVAYADGITHKPNGIYGYPFFDIIANNTTYPVEDGARDPTIVQTARQNIYLPAGDQTIRLQARQMPDGSTASAVIIASIKVRFVRTMD